MSDFISLFDTRTTILLVSIAFFIQASAIGAQAILIREYKGVWTALLGNLSIALGFFLNTLQGILPDWITVVLSNTLLLQGPNLFQIAFSHFLGRTYSKKIIIGFTLLLLAILIYFTYISSNVSARIIGASLIIGTSIFIAVSKLWSARKESYSFSLWLTIIPLSIYGFFFYLRIFTTVVSPPESNFSNIPFQTVTFLLLFLISFLWTLGFILTVSQRLQIDLTDLANTDSLTRIPNRYAVQTFFEKELSRIERYGGEFSILLIDIDDFKRINDRHGHAIGDITLVKSAKIFQEAIRKQDIVGRWGGEEFIIILPSTNEENAHALAERLRQDVSNVIFDELNTPLKLTISVGIAHARNAESSMSIMLKKADDALYVAKATKDTVITAK
ncbi:MAG TPA: GGDEF domain-containing protein [Anaerolineales bacterium]